MTIGSASKRLLSTVVLASLVSASTASAQQAGLPKPILNSVESAGKIVVQPARDVGVAKTRIPPPLLDAMNDPYTVKGLGSCAALIAAIKQLNGVLGDDFTTARQRKENRMARIAQEGGQSIVNAVVPFRGIVREISGAASAQRRLEAAIDAGYAKRGFLRGLHYARRCSSDFS